METLLSGEVLFYGGLVIMGGAVLGGIIAAILITLTGKKLKGELDAEFGENRR